MIAFPDRLMLSSGQLTVELVPEWGSKMISFRTEPDGYEFLSPPPYGPQVPDSAIFAAEDAYGFDEMFPGVYPGPIRPNRGSRSESRITATCGTAAGNAAEVARRLPCGWRTSAWGGTLPRRCDSPTR